MAPQDASGPSQNAADGAPHGGGGAADRSEATLLLQRIEDGDSQAAADFLPLVYDQLRALAGSYFRGQRADHTLEPTALVHEAYLKMVNVASPEYRGSQHFCAVAATAMRQILANHAEAKRAAKRGGDAKRVGLDQVHLTSSEASGDAAVDTVALDDALRRLEAADARLSRIVELCYFGGLTLDGAAEVLEVSRSTVARGWRQARALLNSELSGADSP